MISDPPPKETVARLRSHRAIATFSGDDSKLARLPGEQKMSGMEFQSELPFGEAARSDGYNAWLEQRRRAEAEAARRLGIPLGHRVEVWLKDGVRLRGTLKLFEEMLVIDDLCVDTLKLTVDKTPFCSSDMESCLRLD